MFGTSPERIRRLGLLFRLQWELQEASCVVVEAPKMMLCCRLRGLEICGRRECRFVGRIGNQEFKLALEGGTGGYVSAGASL